MSKLTEIQSELKAPKNQFNKFGGYHYRSCEDIVEALKPLLKKYGAKLTIKDEIVNVGSRFYVKATASFVCGEEKEEITAFAREEEIKKGMDGAQITGAASSYARKYALNGLFLIDDTRDADATNEHKEEKKEMPKESTGDKLVKDIIPGDFTLMEKKKGDKIFYEMKLKNPPLTFFVFDMGIVDQISQAKRFDLYFSEKEGKNGAVFNNIVKIEEK